MLNAMRLRGAAFSLLLPAVAAAQQPTPSRETSVVVTSGEAVLHATPDRAWITFSAESRAATPRETQRRNTDAMKPALDRLRAAGIADEAIKTTAYALEPDWDYSEKGRQLRGYVARNTVMVRVDAVDRVGELLEMVVSAGATTVDNVRFDVKDRATLEREALRLAVADARSRAEAAASGAGAVVDRILRIDEQGITSPPVVMRQTFQATARVAAAPEPAPIETGELEVRAAVTVTSILK